MVEGVVAMFGKGINLDENILRKNRIPLLIHNSDWVKLFSDEKNKQIQESKEELQRLLIKEKELKILEKKLNKSKTKYMKLILKVSEAVNNEENTNTHLDLQLLDQYKEEIPKINEEMEDIKFQLEMLPKEIREVNFQLLTATVEYGYNELKNREKILARSLQEIQNLRARLMELLEIKHDNEEWIDETYTFLHGILGREVIEKIDREKLK